MTIIYSDNITVLEISPDSQWDVGLAKFIDWDPHSNGQLFITHVDPNPQTYPDPEEYDPRDNEGAGNSVGKMLDYLPISFGKKYPNKTPNEIIKIDPGYIVWCRENTSRVFCSDELYMQAKLVKL